MPTYSNGRVPYTVVSVVLATGTDSNGYWEFRCTPAFAARWVFAKKEAERRFGRTIYIRTGWNIYRPYDVQVAARKRACASGNCNGASVAGYSSHGGNWGGRDCLAVDVDPNGLTWDQVDQAMEAAGFSARLITEAMSGIKGGERWHYIDFNAFGPVPAGLGSSTFPTSTPEPVVEPKEWDEMATQEQIAAVVNGVKDSYIITHASNDPDNGIYIASPGHWRKLGGPAEEITRVYKDGQGGTVASRSVPISTGGNWAALIRFHEIFAPAGVRVDGSLAAGPDVQTITARIEAAIASLSDEFDKAAIAAAVRDEFVKRPLS